MLSILIWPKISDQIKRLLLYFLYLLRKRQNFLNIINVYEIKWPYQ